MKTPLFAIVAGALLIAGLVASAGMVKADGAARLARQETAQALQDATRSAAAAAGAQHLADVARIERDSAVARAALATSRANQARIVYRTVSAVVPDTCRSVVLLADSALAAADGVTVELRAALSASQDGERALQTAVDTLLPALQHLRSASSTLVRLDNSLARRSLIARLTPHLGAGLAVGVDALGAPHIIAGVTLGWSF